MASPTSHDGDIVDFDISPTSTIWERPGTRYQGVDHPLSSTDAGASWQTLETPFSLGELGPGYNPLEDVGRLAVVDDTELWVGTREAPLWHYVDGAWLQEPATPKASTACRG